MTATGREFAVSRVLVNCSISLILIHLVVSFVHGLAHSRLRVGLNAPQQIFVWAVIIALPLIAAYLMWKNNVRTGAALQTASMAGALLFGVFYHFIAPGTDNVNHQFSAGLANWTRLFDLTALGIAGLEAIGTGLGIVMVLRAFKEKR
jgi:tryptophan-rich sensory protein